MINRRRNFWLTISLVNLGIVALLGFALRSKILFELRFLDYRNLLNAHSHFSFVGWAGLALITLMIFSFLPEQRSLGRAYQWILSAIQISALGMGIFFPFFGYNYITITFSSLYMVATVALTIFFTRDILASPVDRSVRLMSIAALLCLCLSFLGVAGLSYIMVTHTGGAILYRDSTYTFLHFQYNGFFTLSVFALTVHFWVKKMNTAGKDLRLFALYLTASIIPSLFLSLLWHDSTLFYVIAGLACILIMLCLYYFIRPARMAPSQIFRTRTAKLFCLFSVVSFILKMILQVGTIFPALGNAVYGDRPVIIGFLHLVFLGFVTFFILAILVDEGFFTKNTGPLLVPVYIFSTGIFANELLLMLQGLGILLNTNNDIYKWLLWITAIILFLGAFWMAVTAVSVYRTQRKK